MAAPSVAVLYDFETPMELAAASAIGSTLAAASISASIGISRDNSIEDTPRIEIQFAVGAAMAQRTTQGQFIPKEVPNAFEGNFTVRVVTTRNDTTANNAIHGTLRGLVRYAMSAGAKAIPPELTPYWQILQMLPDGSSPQIYDEKQQDTTELSFHVWFAIRNDAWINQSSLVAPTISVQPANTSVAAGADTTLSVTGSGTPNSSFQWRKDGVLILGKIAATLAINDAVAADAGSYDCVLSNAAGAVVSTAATLTVT